MSKKQFKSQASSTRAGAGVYNDSNDLLRGSLPSRPFGTGPSSALSYVYEPPDLTFVDPQLAVIYKSLQKKDSITKVKALEDLKTYASSQEFDVEDQRARDGLLEPWIRLYPRTSIDASQRVRQLAHTFQGQVSMLYGKRIAKSLPQSIGAWICGQYDSDRGVARTASETLKQIFPTEEKFSNAWKAYLSYILDFCSGAITKESVQTLSDERITSPDEAKGKHVRVVSTAMSALQHILGDLPQAALAKDMSSINELLRDKNLWKLATDPEFLIRRSVYRLLKISLEHWRHELDMPILSRHMITSGLRIDQTGCDTDFMTALSFLTIACPAVWTSLYTGKKTATNALISYLNKANPGLQSSYWSALGTLLLNIPTTLHQSQELDAEHEPTREERSGIKKDSILAALKDCIGRQARMRIDPGPAWTVYLDTTERRLELMEGDEAKQTLLSGYVLPLVSQYITKSCFPPNGSATTTTTDDPKILERAFHQILRYKLTFAIESWQHLSDTVVEATQVSLPEQSKDYRKSQDELGFMLQRWYGLRSALSMEHSESSMIETYDRTLTREVQVMSNVLETRNGKPYGAAIGLASAMDCLPSNSSIARDVNQQIFDLLLHNMTVLMRSPSSVCLIRIIPKFESNLDVRSLYRSALEGSSDDSNDAALAALDLLFGSDDLYSSLGSNEPGVFLEKKIQKAVDGNDRNWNLVASALVSSGPTAALRSKVINLIVTGVHDSETRDSSLKGLRILRDHYDRLLVDEDDNGDSRLAFGGMLPKLLQMVEFPNQEAANTAEEMIAKLINKASKTRLLAIAKAMFVAVTKAEGSPSVNKLVKTTSDVLNRYCNAGYKMEEMQNVLLSFEEEWSNGLAHCIYRRLPTGLAVTETLDILCLSENPDVMPAHAQPGTTSEYKASILLVLRASDFAMELVSHDAFMGECNQETLDTIFQDILRSQAIVEMYRRAGFIDMSTGEEEQSLNSRNDVFTRTISCINIVRIDSLTKTRATLSASSLGKDSPSFYNSRALAFLLRYGGKVDIHPEELNLLPNSTGIFRSTQILKFWKDESTLMKLCNKLLAELTGLDMLKNQDHGLGLMVNLDALVAERHALLEQVPRQRLVFFVKHLIKQSRTDALSSDFKAAIMRVLLPVLPLLKDLYESFWEELVHFLEQSWEPIGDLSDNMAFTLGTNLRLYRTLKSLTQEPACNDDLNDALAAKSETLDTILIKLLPNLAEKPKQVTYWEIIQQDVALLASGMRVVAGQDLSRLYTIFDRPSPVLQLAAHKVLQRSISGSQGEISVEKALTKDYVAELPEKLLAVILTAPDPEARHLVWGDSGGLPFEVQGYLLGWLLIFSHWTNSSQRVQEDYVSAIDGGGYLPTLLAFAIEYLIDGRNQLPNASKYDITTFETTPLPPDTFSAAHCLFHLYFLSLRHLPTLVRSWWQDSAPRQSKTILESWTERYFTPSIVAAEISTLSSDHIPTLTQEDNPTTSSDDHRLEIRTSIPAREITAAIPIDETTMRIAIRLPGSYPLARATVDSVQRVGVDEKKWRGWLLHCQGVINFSRVGGPTALADGLAAWKTHVTARLRGQSECAICYSVVGVGADKQLPSKKCSTCGNLFHGGCLYRWFKSSNSSGCPLCRNAFQYA